MAAAGNIENFLEDKNKSFNHFNINEFIFREGEKIKGIYFIKNGRIKVTRKAKNDMTVWFAKSNEFIGLNSYFNESENYSYSSSAFSGEVNTLFIPSKEFKKLLEEIPVFKQEIIQILCDRIGSTRRKISEIKSQSIKVRVLNAILLLIDKDDLNKATVDIQYSIRELSELAGTSNQYIKKLISEFQKNDLLEIKDDRLIIDMHKLHLASS